jgi:hypothetical protein
LFNYLTGFRIESEFKNGVCLNDPTWALVHGDNKQKMHRFCLAKIDQDFTPNSEDEDSATNNSSENVYEPEVLDKYMPAPLKKKGIKKKAIKPRIVFPVATQDDQEQANIR